MQLTLISLLYDYHYLVVCYFTSYFISTKLRLDRSTFKHITYYVTENNILYYNIIIIILLGFILLFLGTYFFFSSSYPNRYQFPINQMVVTLLLRNVLFEKPFHFRLSFLCSDESFCCGYMNIFVLDNFLEIL